MSGAGSAPSQAPSRRSWAQHAGLQGWAVCDTGKPAGCRHSRVSRDYELKRDWQGSPACDEEAMQRLK